MAAEPSLSSAEVRRRGTAGVAALATQGAVTQVLALGGNLVLARLLLPRDFGVVAFGMSLTTFLTLAAGVGLAAALIRREEPPKSEELEAFFGLQLLASVVLAAVTGTVALLFGEPGRVTALMVLALPLAALQAIPMVILERRLSYRPIALIGILENVVFYVWTIAAVVGGWGVWGLASGFVVRALVTSITLLVIVPDGRVRPRLSLAPVRGLLAFGIGVQAVPLIGLLGEQLLNFGIAAVAGLAVLGLWTLANRLLQIPFFLFGALWRVSFPSMARLLERGEDPRPIMEQALRLVSIATGAMFTPIAASAPAAIPAVLGDAWSEAAYILPAACLGLMVSGPVSVATFGYLWALGDTRTPILAAVLRTLTLLAVALPLLPLVGPLAIGIAFLAQTLVDAFVLVRGSRRHTELRVFASLALPIAIAIAVGTAGWLVAFFVRPTLLAAVATAVLAATLYICALAVAGKERAREFVSVAGRAMRTAFSPSA